MAASSSISVAASACAAASIPYPSLYGAEFLSKEATLVTNYSQAVAAGVYANHGAVDVSNANFCNITVTYTHPGQSDTVTVQVWLPVGDSAWNGRLQAIGGGGWLAGLDAAALMGMTAAVGEGYAAVSTDGGIPNVDANGIPEWALLSPGNVNLYKLQNLGSTTLNDMAVIGKSVSASLYGQAPTYSYYSGCSQGGRQGYMLAQQYPDAFDGIAASAPALGWNRFVLLDYWPAFYMRLTGTVVPECEFEAITAAVIEACDTLDGVNDGVISDLGACNFNASSFVGQTIQCGSLGNASRTISSTAADIVDSVWQGLKLQDGTLYWPGIEKGAVMTTTTQGGIGILSSTCTGDSTCSLVTLGPIEAWIKLFFQKNESAVLNGLTRDDIDRFAKLFAPTYDSIMGTENPDLSSFRERGGKFISYHGMADSVIPHRGSTQYYDAVQALDPNVSDYFRLFLAPGLGHCFLGGGAYPDGTFDAMRRWVEQGVVPDTLNATSLISTPTLQRILCPYPKQQYYDGVGDASAGQGFYCK